MIFVNGTAQKNCSECTIIICWTDQSFWTQNVDQTAYDPFPWQYIVGFIQYPALWALQGKRFGYIWFMRACPLISGHLPQFIHLFKCVNGLGKSKLTQTVVWNSRFLYNLSLNLNLVKMCARGGQNHHVVRNYSYWDEKRQNYKVCILLEWIYQYSRRIMELVTIKKICGFFL